MSISPAYDDSGKRFSTVDDNHHGGILWITASLSMTYFVLSCILRVHLSYRQLTKDTVSLVVATVCLAIVSVLRDPLSWKELMLTYVVSRFWVLSK
jgi:hypothetical protein